MQPEKAEGHILTIPSQSTTSTKLAQFAKALRPILFKYDGNTILLKEQFSKALSPILFIPSGTVITPEYDLSQQIIVEPSSEITRTLSILIYFYKL
jgi:hypothetical protein